MAVSAFSLGKEIHSDRLVPPGNKILRIGGKGGLQMQDFEDKSDNPSQNRDIRSSFFTRRLANKLNQKGSPIPPPIMVFLDTPLCTFNDDQKDYFDNKFCPLIPTLISLLEEIFNELGADREGWDDLLTYGSKSDTPIKICARAVSVKKEKESENHNANSGMEQQTKKIQMPPQHDRLNPSMC
jgi:hypothetical protein